MNKVQWRRGQEVYAVQIGSLVKFPHGSIRLRRDTKKAIKLMKTMRGLEFVLPSEKHGTLLFFSAWTLANACRHSLMQNGIKTGNDICWGSIDMNGILKLNGCSEEESANPLISRLRQILGGRSEVT